MEWKLCLYFLFLSVFSVVSSDIYNNCVLSDCEDEPIPIEDYIRQHGYPVEAHEITTDDGYILTYHRIPHGKTSSGRIGKPVLLQHGLLASSAAWVITDESLGFTLADAGFDLWLGNARGNTYSRKHKTYNPDKDKRAFWNFSWHEMGYYDLPASIDYILNVTKHQQLLYIGHSMGTTMFFVLGASKPDYMAKVEAAVLLAPVAYPYNIRSPIANFVNDLQPSLDSLLRSVDIYEVFPTSRGTYWLDENICSRELLQFLCRDIVFEIAGFDNPEVNRTSFPIILNYMPAGASVKQLQHYSQICKTDADFRYFDYGPIGNMWKYHSHTPPPYNLTNVKAPLYIHYALNDWLAVPEDVFFTVIKLPNVRIVREVPDEKFNHVDFMWAIDGKKLLYHNIVETLHNLPPSCYRMVSCLVLVVLCLFVCVQGDNECRSTFCFKLWSRSINIDFNLFEDTEPLPIEDYIRQQGYPVEPHEITTDDGYILTYHRIPHGKSNSTTAGRKPVLLQHGLLGASSVWVLSSYALGYALADAGFDVWLGNARGNTYSKKHLDLDPVLDKRDFWDFSWHEMGYYDLPASIDYILNVTKHQQLFYIGHSMGTTMFFVLGASRPDYMAKVEAAVLLAPVAYPWHIKSPLTNFLSRLHSVISVLATTAGVYEIFPYSRSMLWVERNLCSFSMFRWMNVCEDIMKWIGGFNEQELKRIPLSTMLQYQPAGASFKTLKHFRQISEETDFRNFNYDSLSNLYTGNYRAYGQFDPPLYDLGLVTAPLYIYYANSDWLSVPEDVLYTVDLLPNVKNVTKVPDKDFNHLDFCWADDAKTLVYDDIILRLNSLK
ncbi:uncharacterized protein LOC128984823 [Macrosteles quadrilineatus]|uniref:uncharacterized protein LOC128984823 n=1 Tax=Macrosteles quadrilineatus TaxID=74068 RepID=UPI0023E30106|nr:uncharacterized protein LOC128984823 [Macrosteles quadrilineatus]